MPDLTHRPELVGTVDFICPQTGRTIDISPYYAGEDPLGPELAHRACRAVDMLNKPSVVGAARPEQVFSANRIVRPIHNPPTQAIH